MNGRWVFLIAGLAASAVAGCGDASSAKFVLSNRTQALDPPARKAVDAELVRSFGDPNQLVVWRKLPVDFGEFEGTVEEPGQKMDDRFTVQLVRNAESKVPLTPDAFKGAGIVWTSGENVDLVGSETEGKDKGKETPITFQVVDYIPNDSQLRIRVDPAKFSGKLTPPKKGDKFSLIGPVLQHGRKLYMTHCEHCHGVSGDGNGPTAASFDIKPRDYRLGIFKFTSTTKDDKIRRSDLERTVRQGIPGTYMPSFLLFRDDEIGAIVEYVRWLAMRGEFEQKVDVEFEAEQYSKEAVEQREKGGEKAADIHDALAKFTTERLPEIANTSSDDLVTSWKAAEQLDKVVLPKTHRVSDSTESRERGRKLFFSDLAKCGQCHGASGRGDGPQTEDYQTITGTNKKYDKPGLFDVWGHAIKPRDLTSGIYRGGRRPLDIYRRVYSGIKGTPMPPFDASLKDDQIWDLVNYVMSLPYQKGSERSQQPQQPKVASAAESASHGVGEN